MKVSARFAICFSMACVLSACGGGGGNGAPGGGPAITGSGISAEGIYAGKLTGSTSPDFLVAILEDGSYWGFYGQNSAAGWNYFYSLIQGSGTSNTAAGMFNSYSGADFGFIPPAGISVGASYSASPVSISGAVNYSSKKVTFTGGALTGTTYQYNQPAKLADVTGTWSMSTSVSNGDTLTLQISSTGAYSGKSQQGCTFSGTIQPRASGKNVFDINVKFGGTPCDLANQTTTGIAMVLPNSSGHKQLVFAVVDAGHEHGFAGYSTN